MKQLRQALSPAGYAGLICLFLAILIATPALPNNTNNTVLAAPLLQTTATPTSPAVFEISLADLGYEEKTLNSPYGATEYTLRLPEGWQIRKGSSFELDFSYTYNRLNIPESQWEPLSLLGNIIVTVDGETQLVFPIKETLSEHSRSIVELPPSLLNDPDRSSHSIQITLDAGLICEIPHQARLIIHPTSFFSLAYEQLPLTIDLARYPRPFYQRTFEPDQVRFVLPEQPTDKELAGAVAVAAKLGDLTYNMAISGTTGLALANRLDSGEAIHEHLFVIGRPDDNEIILRLNQLGILPVSLRKRQLSLASEGPVAVVPGDILTYTLTLTNTSQETLSSLSLLDTLPANAQVEACNPTCSETEKEVKWSIPSLEPKEVSQYTLALRVSEAITDSIAENTVTLLDKTSRPINLSTLTTIVSSEASEAGSRASISAASDYFFVHGGQAVPENDGIVQELLSPWDQTRAILIITGLSDEAVYKASRALSSESHFPGTQGDVALVRETRPLPENPPEPQATELTFADLGYSDKVLEGYSQETTYYFDIPLAWRLTNEATLDLRFSHSQLLDYGNSFFNILFNGNPVATIALNNETSLNGTLKVKLPSDQARPGQNNKISIQSVMHPIDRCMNVNTWLLVSSESLLHLNHKEQSIPSLDLDFYPYPFDQRSDLADVLFVLPSEPLPEEWEETLQLAAALGDAAGGPNLAPAVSLESSWSETNRVDYHIIAVGRPLRNLVLQQINEQLPQPFRRGSNEIEQRIDNVIFRLPPGLSLGLVQLLPSPWNEERVFLAITGTTDEGVKWAMDLVSERYWDLNGNLTLIREDKISTINTHRLTSSGQAAAMATAVPEMTPVVTITPTPQPSGASATPGPAALEQVPAGSDRPSWLIPLVGGTVLAIVIIMAIAFWQARRQR